MYILLIDTFTTKAYHFEVPDGQQSEETEEIISELGFNLSNIDYISSNEPIVHTYIDSTEVVEAAKKIINKK